MYAQTMGGGRLGTVGKVKSVVQQKPVQSAESQTTSINPYKNIGKNNPNYDASWHAAISNKKMPADIYSSKKVITEGITSRGTKIQSIPNGTTAQAFKDFNSLNLKNVKIIQTKKGEMRTGDLPDGRTVKFRPSNDGGRGRYTIDIIKTNNRTEREIRYGNRN